VFLFAIGLSIIHVIPVLKYIATWTPHIIFFIKMDYTLEFQQSTFFRSYLTLILWIESTIESNFQTHEIDQGMNVYGK
jgi:hypothetical protein